MVGSGWDEMARARALQMADEKRPDFKRFWSAHNPVEGGICSFCVFYWQLFKQMEELLK